MTSFVCRNVTIKKNIGHLKMVLETGNGALLSHIGMCFPRQMSIPSHIVFFLIVFYSLYINLH